MIRRRLVNIALLTSGCNQLAGSSELHLQLALLSTEQVRFQLGAVPQDGATPVAGNSVRIEGECPAAKR